MHKSDQNALHGLVMNSPIGELTLVAGEQGLHEIRFGRDMNGVDLITDNLVLQATQQQLQEYFMGDREQFDLPLKPKGTEFQQNVWQVLLTVKHGCLASYQDIANSIGNPKAVRAVGAANGRNPIPIVIPCHRIIGSNGKLTGYAGGLNIKDQLLRLEGAIISGPLL